MKLAQTTEEHPWPYGTRVRVINPEYGESCGRTGTVWEPRPLQALLAKELGYYFIEMDSGGILGHISYRSVERADATDAPEATYKGERTLQLHDKVTFEVGGETRTGEITAVLPPHGFEHAGGLYIVWDETHKTLDQWLGRDLTLVGGTGEATYKAANDLEPGTRVRITDPKYFKEYGETGTIVEGGGMLATMIGAYWVKLDKTGKRELFHYDVVEPLEDAAPEATYKASEDELLPVGTRVEINWPDNWSHGKQGVVVPNKEMSAYQRPPGFVTVELPGNAGSYWIMPEQLIVLEDAAPEATYKALKLADAPPYPPEMPPHDGELLAVFYGTATWIYLYADAGYVWYDERHGWLGLSHNAHTNWLNYFKDPENTDTYWTRRPLPTESDTPEAAYKAQAGVIPPFAWVRVVSPRSEYNGMTGRLTSFRSDRGDCGVLLETEYSHLLRYFPPEHLERVDAETGEATYKADILGYRLRPEEVFLYQAQTPVARFQDTTAPARKERILSVYAPLEPHENPVVHDSFDDTWTHPIWSTENVLERILRTYRTVMGFKELPVEGSSPEATYKGVKLAQEDAPWPETLPEGSIFKTLYKETGSHVTYLLGPGPTLWVVNSKPEQREVLMGIGPEDALWRSDALTDVDFPDAQFNATRSMHSYTGLRDLFQDAEPLLGVVRYGWGGQTTPEATYKADADSPFIFEIGDTVIWLGATEGRVWKVIHRSVEEVENPDDPDEDTLTENWYTISNQGGGLDGTDFYVVSEDILRHAPQEPETATYKAALPDGFYRVKEIVGDYKGQVGELVSRDGVGSDAWYELKFPDRIAWFHASELEPVAPPTSEATYKAQAEFVVGRKYRIRDGLFTYLDCRVGHLEQYGPDPDGSDLTCGLRMDGYMDDGLTWFTESELEPVPEGDTATYKALAEGTFDTESATPVARFRKKEGAVYTYYWVPGWAKEGRYGCTYGRGIQLNGRVPPLYQPLTPDSLYAYLEMTNRDTPEMAWVLEDLRPGTGPSESTYKAALGPEYDGSGVRARIANPNLPVVWGSLAEVGDDSWKLYIGSEWHYYAVLLATRSHYTRIALKPTLAGAIQHILNFLDFRTRPLEEVFAEYKTHPVDPEVEVVVPGTGTAEATYKGMKLAQADDDAFFVFKVGDIVHWLGAYEQDALWEIVSREAEEVENPADPDDDPEQNYYGIILHGGSTENSDVYYVPEDYLRPAAQPTAEDATYKAQRDYTLDEVYPMALEAAREPIVHIWQWTAWEDALWQYLFLTESGAWWHFNAKDREVTRATRDEDTVQDDPYWTEVPVPIDATSPATYKAEASVDWSSLDAMAAWSEAELQAFVPVDPQTVLDDTFRLYMARWNSAGWEAYVNVVLASRKGLRNVYQGNTDNRRQAVRDAVEFIRGNKDLYAAAEDGSLYSLDVLQSLLVPPTQAGTEAAYKAEADVTIKRRFRCIKPNSGLYPVMEFGIDREGRVVSRGFREDGSTPGWFGSSAPHVVMYPSIKFLPGTYEEVSVGTTPEEATYKAEATTLQVGDRVRNIFHEWTGTVQSVMALAGGDLVTVDWDDGHTRTHGVWCVVKLPDGSGTEGVYKAGMETRSLKPPFDPEPYGPDHEDGYWAPMGEMHPYLVPGSLYYLKGPENPQPAIFEKNWGGYLWWYIGDDLHQVYRWFHGHDTEHRTKVRAHEGPDVWETGHRSMPVWVRGTDGLAHTGDETDLYRWDQTAPGSVVRGSAYRPRAVRPDVRYAVFLGIVDGVPLGYDLGGDNEWGFTPQFDDILIGRDQIDGTASNVVRSRDLRGVWQRIGRLGQATLLRMSGPPIQVLREGWGQ